MTTAGSLPVPNNWINDKFGSKKGLLRYGYFEAKRLVGQFDSLIVESDFKPTRLVFICAGNICRSPLGELVASSKGFDATSFGLHTRGGDPADLRAVDCARRFGYDLSKHRTRRIDQYDYNSGDLIIAMEPKHLTPLRENFNCARITLLGLYNEKPQSYIHDPYNTNSNFFTNCEELIISASTSLISHVS